VENKTRRPDAEDGTLQRLGSSILWITVAAVFALSPTFPACAGQASQTILNPATPRKSAYPKIVVYTVSWCPHCRELKEYLTSHNIPFINRDVELEPAAMEQLVQKYSSYGVPVVIFGDDQEILKGFTPVEFEKIVNRMHAGSKP
jgi:glutaredoxin-like YruB-family protein